MNTAEIIYQKSKSFPEPIAKEALDFINYLEYKCQVVAQENKPKNNQKEKPSKWALLAREIESNNYFDGCS